MAPFKVQYLHCAAFLVISRTMSMLQSSGVAPLVLNLLLCYPKATFYEFINLDRYTVFSKNVLKIVFPSSTGTKLEY